LPSARFGELKLCIFRRAQQRNDGNTSLCTVAAAAVTRRQSMLSKRRVTLMVIVVVAVFAVCWLPLHVAFLIQYSFPVSSWLVIVKIPCTCLAYVNSCLNPFLYAFLSHNFQRSVARRLCAANQLGALPFCLAASFTCI